MYRNNQVAYRYFATGSPSSLDPDTGFEAYTFSPFIFILDIKSDNLAISCFAFFDLADSVSIVFFEASVCLFNFCYLIK